MPKANKTTGKKTKSVYEMLDEAFKPFSTYAQPAVPFDFGNGRHGWQVSLFGKGNKFLGNLRLVFRPEDGEYSVSFDLGGLVLKELAEAGVKVHKRAKPTRTVLNVRQMLAMA